MSSTKSYITLKEKYDRVIVLIDMDCFYCQVEELLDPVNLTGKPIAVVQYVENAGIIAVNYAARALGVTRHMREKEAKAACPDLVCVKVPSKFNKADISKYRDAGKRVANVFEKFTTMLERASIDEAYMDITENVAERVQQLRDRKFTLTAQHLNNTYIVGYDNIGKFIQEISMTVDKVDQIDEDPEQKSLESSKLRLLIGASIVNDIRAAVKEETGYTCSAGIAHNKILAKLVCGMNKPNKQTVIPIDSIPKLFETLNISKIKSMGGKIGEEVCKKLNVKVMAELLPFPESELQQHFGTRIGSFLYWMARGIDLEKVERKVMSKSIAVSKNFRGKNEIMNVNTLKYWLKELSKELKERLDKDHEETNRLSKQMIVQYTQIYNKKDVASSRTVQLNGRSVNNFTSDEIGEEAFKTIERNTAQLLKAEGTCILNNNIKHLGISAGKLEDANAQGSSKSVTDFLKNYTKSPKVEVENGNLFAKYEYSPSGSKIGIIKSEEVMQNPEKSPQIPVRPSKSENFASKIKVLSPKTINTSRDSKIPQNSSIKPKIEENSEVSKSESSSLKSSIKFTKDSCIRGERTLSHWISQLLTELDQKVLNEKLNPSTIKLSWRQVQNDEIKDQSEEVPLDIFTNGINTEFFINLIKDSGSDGSFNPIISLDIETFGASTDVRWKLNVEQSHNESEIYTEDTQVPDEQNQNLTMDTSFTPTDDFYDENIQPEDLLDMKMSVDEDEDEILRLERSFLGLSPQKPKNKIDSPKNSANVSPEVSNCPETSNLEPQPGPSYQNSYVELQKPPNVSNMIDILNPLEECMECGKMIRKLDMLTHIDMHIAMKLSQAQRDEFRAEQKRKILEKINSNKKVQKTKTGSTSSTQKSTKNHTQKIPTIDKFTRKESAGNTSWDNSVLCEICNQLIEVDSYQMHQDYHFAQKLRMEQMTVRTNTTNSGKKRKRPNPGNSCKKDVNSAKSLKEYFKE